jgi:hypothetical protein
MDVLCCIRSNDDTAKVPFRTALLFSSKISTNKVSGLLAIRLEDFGKQSNQFKHRIHLHRNAKLLF